MFKNNMNNVLVLFSVLSLFVSTVYAEDKDYKNRISFGGFFLSNYDSELGLSSAKSGVGVKINPRKALGMDSEQTVFRLDGAYRFNENHSLMYSWYSIKSSGKRTIDEEIPWDPPIPVGASLESTLNTDIYKLGYLWSFHNDEKVELGIGLGLHFTQIRLELSGDATGTPYQSESVRTTVPLPVVLFKIGYRISPKLKVSYLSQIFAIEFDDINGNYADQTLGVEYQFWENVSLGLALNGTNLSIEQETDNRHFSFNNRITGAVVFIGGYF